MTIVRFALVGVCNKQAVIVSTSFNKLQQASDNCLFQPVNNIEVGFTNNILVIPHVGWSST